MISWLLMVLRTFRGMARSHISLAAENAILRHQLAVLQRGRSRPLLRTCGPSAMDLALPALEEVLHIKGIPIPYGAPNAVAHIERFMGSLKRECLNHFSSCRKITFAAPSRATSPTYNGARPHQGIRRHTGVWPRPAEGLSSCDQGTVRSSSWRTRCSAAFTTTTDSPRSFGLVRTPLRPAPSGPVVPTHAPNAGF